MCTLLKRPFNRNRYWDPLTDKIYTVDRCTGDKIFESPKTGNPLKPNAQSNIDKEYKIMQGWKKSQKKDQSKKPHPIINLRANKKPSSKDEDDSLDELDKYIGTVIRGIKPLSAKFGKDLPSEKKFVKEIKKDLLENHLPETSEEMVAFLNSDPRRKAKVTIEDVERGYLFGDGLNKH